MCLSNLESLHESPRKRTYSHNDSRYPSVEIFGKKRQWGLTQIDVRSGENRMKALCPHCQFVLFRPPRPSPRLWVSTKSSFLNSSLLLLLLRLLHISIP